MGKALHVDHLRIAGWKSSEGLDYAINPSFALSTYMSLSSD